MCSSESDIDEVRVHEWKPGESSIFVSVVENTNDKTKQVGLKLVQNDDKPSPVKKPNHIQRVKFPIDSSHAESKKIIKSQ
jgi:hypothetical protein